MSISQGKMLRCSFLAFGYTRFGSTRREFSFFFSRWKNIGREREREIFDANTRFGNIAAGSFKLIERDFTTIVSTIIFYVELSQLLDFSRAFGLKITLSDAVSSGYAKRNTFTIDSE